MVNLLRHFLVSKTPSRTKAFHYFKSLCPPFFRSIFNFLETNSIAHGHSIWRRHGLRNRKKSGFVPADRFVFTTICPFVTANTVAFEFHDVFADSAVAVSKW